MDFLSQEKIQRSFNTSKISKPLLRHNQNRSPHRFFKDKTPYEAWSGLKLEVTHFHIFGSRAWARITSKKRKALDPQSTECIFVGYPDGVKGYTH
jgi:hypothetical protein